MTPFQRREKGVSALQKMLSNHDKNVQNVKILHTPGFNLVEKDISVLFILNFVAAVVNFVFPRSEHVFSK